MGTHLFVWTDRAVRRTLPGLGVERAVLATDEATPEDHEAYDEVVALPPVWEMEAVVDALERVEADEVFYQTEFGLLAGSILASRRGLPGPTPLAAHLCTNKLASRRALAAAGVPVPRFGLCGTAADVRRLGLGYPLVVKPVASTLGRGVAKVERDADLDAAVARLLRWLPTGADVRRLAAFGRVAGVDLGCDPTRHFLAEAFAPGPPLEADGMLVGDRAQLFGVVEQRVRDGSGFYMEGYLLPADAPGRAAESALAAVGASALADTGFCVELRGDVVIEVNGRLGEDDGFPDLFRAALGFLPMERWFRRDEAPVPAASPAAVAYVNRYAAGTVARVGPVPPGVVVTAPAGTRIAAPDHPAYRTHLAYAVATHPTSSRAAYAEARARLDRLELVVDDAPPAAGA